MLQINKKKPDPIDISVGARVRSARKSAGMTQEVLANRLGITFQQVQKYEKGTNRIGCSRLVHIARAVGVVPAWFLAEYCEDSDSIKTAGIEKALRSENEGLREKLAEVRRIVGK